MLSKVLGTISGKLGLAVSNFITIVLITKFLGKEGRGEVGLFTTNLTLILHFCAIMGGSAISYLAPRRNKRSLLLPSYLWSIAVSILLGATFLLLNKIQYNQLIYIVLISVLNGLYNTNITLVLGKEKIKQYNYLSLLQPLSLLLFLVPGFLYLQSGIVLYYQLLLFSFVLAFLMSSYAVFRIKEDELPNAKVKEVLFYGVKAQGANIAQFINYRLCYYFIADDASLGIYANAIALSEGLWILGRSLATVQYAKIVNSTEDESKSLLSLLFVKLSFTGTLAGTLILILLPSSFFVWLFNEDFYVLPQYLLYLSPGIVAIAVAANLSAYFGGIGKFEISLQSSLIGMGITIIGCYTLVSSHNLVGACISTSTSYCVLTAYLLLIFIRKNNISASKFLFSKEDLTYLKELFHKN